MLGGGVVDVGSRCSVYLRDVYSRHGVRHGHQMFCLFTRCLSAYTSCNLKELNDIFNNSLRLCYVFVVRQSY